MSGRGRAKKSGGEVVDWDGVAAQDGECAAARGFRLRDKLKDDQYENKESMVDTLTGRELTLEYMQSSGFVKPVLVTRRDDLGLKVPPRDLTVEGVRSAVGSRRMVDVVDSKTQISSSMCMKDWCKYWNTEPREEILNGISLEFSKTRLDQQVTAPRVVRQVDWVEKAWPRHLKELQEESGNSIEEMMYPKVQKFVMMSVANTFLDFHVDFSGTSVWYYVHRGHKVFWLVPPTDSNLLAYEAWVTGEDRAGWFPDRAEGCTRLDLHTGTTMFLPAGWIHAAFTARDSIVFSGSFLHSFAVEKQLKVAFLEESLGVPDQFRFPFYTEMLWYVLERYVTCLTGKSHLDLPAEEKRRMRLEKGENIDPNKEFINPGLSEEAPAVPTEHIHLTQPELLGLQYIVIYIQNLQPEDMQVPVLIPDPVSLISAVRELVTAHMEDCPEKAVTGRYILRWTEDDDVDEDGKSKKIIPRPGDFTHTRQPDNPFQKKYQASQAGRGGGGAGMEAPRRRRARCGACPGCAEKDCQTCPACRDMPKHGGPGRLKQSCVRRRCARPVLPVAAACSICGLDGWGASPDHRRQPPAGQESSLLECLSCFDIVHPECWAGPGRGERLARLPNSWECPNCVGGRQQQQQTPMES